MAKATSPRKPAREKRKGSAAAKRTASKRAPRARKFTASASHPRGVARVIGRPSGGRALPRARRTQGPSTDVVVAAAAPEPTRTPPPLPVPIASFTF